MGTHKKTLQLLQKKVLTVVFEAYQNDISHKTLFSDKLVK